eukprot:5139969-Amphidinium_carterae.1
MRTSAKLPFLPGRQSRNRVIKQLSCTSSGTLTESTSPCKRAEGTFSLQTLLTDRKPLRNPRGAKASFLGV